MDWGNRWVTAGVHLSVGMPHTECEDYCAEVADRSVRAPFLSGSAEPSLSRGWKGLADVEDAKAYWVDVWQLDELLTLAPASGTWQV